MDINIHPHRGIDWIPFYIAKIERSMFFPGKLAECGARVPAEDSSDSEFGIAVSDENFYELIDSYRMLHR